MMNDETLYWLELLLDKNLGAAGKLQPLMKENNELLAILTKISKRAKGLE